MILQYNFNKTLIRYPAGHHVKVLYNTKILPQARHFKPYAPNSGFLCINCQIHVKKCYLTFII